MVERYIVKLWVVNIAFLAIGVPSDVQIRDDLSFIIEKNPIEVVTKAEVSPFTFKETSELKLIATGLIRLYQLFISTQDMPVCNFTLTCSRFGMAAIRRYGFFYGILMTSDRLQRCNGVIGRKYYSIDPKTGLAIDYPIEVYYLGPKSEKSIGIENKE